MIERWIVLAAEEAGPASNKMGGIWNVVDAEAVTLARLAARGKIESGLHILVAGPNYPASGSDWNTGKNRVTDLSGWEALQPGEELKGVLASLNASGIEAATAQRIVEGVPIAYVLFNTDYYDSHMVRWKGKEMTRSNAIKTEAFELLGLDSMNYERAHYGREYNHYLNLSYAVSEFVRLLALSHEEMARKYADKAVSDFAKAVMPKVRVSLHCHEFGYSMQLPGLRSWVWPSAPPAPCTPQCRAEQPGYKSCRKIASK